MGSITKKQQSILREKGDEINEIEDMFWQKGGLFEQMDQQVSDEIKARRTIDDNYKDYVSFSAYPDDYRSNNLLDIAIKGRCQFVEQGIVRDDEDAERLYNRYLFGDMPAGLRRDYKSEILTDPTWLELCVCANDMINTIGDNHHIFLEGFELTPDSFRIDETFFYSQYRFIMGS